MSDSRALSATGGELRNLKRGGLWHDHAATPKQNEILFPAQGKQRATQADVLIELLRRALAERRGLELPEIMQVGIAQHGARFHEIRLRGFEVENQIERTEDGRTISRYFLRHDPERDIQ